MTLESSNSNAASSSATTSPCVAKTSQRTEYSHSHGWTCGLASGILQTVVFNPYDRALFLSVRDHRPFLSPDNFRTPFQGILQAIQIRALSAGLYFPLEHFFEQEVFSKKHYFLAGSAAGVLSSAILNPLTAIKYQTWGREGAGELRREAGRMWRRGGIAPFLFGLQSRLVRDAIFGALYTGIRRQAIFQEKEDGDGHEEGDDEGEAATSNEGGGAFSSRSRHRNGLHQFVINAGAAVVATIVSGPFNFVQNVQYATSSRNEQKSIGHILARLIRKTQQEKGLFKKLSYLQERLRWGWGTCRVAIGMAVGNFLYDGCMNQFSDKQ